MIPYFSIGSFQLGPLAIQVWGLCVSLGLAAGLILSLRLIRRYFLSPALFLDLAMFAVVAGFIGGRIFYILFYAPDYYFSRPADAFKFWRGGSSSLGGFLGAALAVWIFLKIKKIIFREILPYLDLAAPGLWLGWGIGRLGCFLIHDHPGRLSDFFLAVNFPGGARHDLGLYDSLLAFGLFAIGYWLFTRLIKIRWGLLSVVTIYLYAVIRFLLDFLRATDLVYNDPRYAGLTPAQWGMIAGLVLLTLALFWGKMRRKNNVDNIKY